MGTKSHIAIEREDGAVESIRCQYDGYPAYNGALLLQHYNTPDRVNALIGLGNITYLAEELEPTGVHSFEEPQEGVTLAYGRDRGAENTSATRYNSAQEYSHIIRNAAGTERVQYAYLYREQEGAWYWLPMHCSGRVRIFQPLTRSDACIA
jgi:hypothetical protein